MYTKKSEFKTKIEKATITKLDDIYTIGAFAPRINPYSASALGGSGEYTARSVPAPMNSNTRQNLYNDVQTLRQVVSRTTAVYQNLTADATFGAQTELITMAFTFAKIGMINPAVAAVGIGMMAFQEGMKLYRQDIQIGYIRSRAGFYNGGSSTDD